MKHPAPEEWIPFVFDEAEGATRKRLQAHLDECVECRSQLAGWQAGREHLDMWKLPPARRRWQGNAAFRWAAAAVVMLSAGFCVGRLTAGRVDVEKLHERLRPELREQLRRDMAAELRTALARLETQRLADWVSLKKELDMVALTTDASFRDTQRQLRLITEVGEIHNTTPVEP
jgi:hypothetical protein